MFVRTASARDLEAVHALLVETWHDTYDAIYGGDRVTAITSEWHSMPALEARLSRPKSEFLVADDGKRIGGAAFAAIDPDASTTLMLQQLYVLPAFQGKGIGGQLLDEIESCFPEASTVRLEVEEKNTRAVAFYLAQGFSKGGYAETRENEDVGILIFERPIVWVD